ncbi:hypothetical protein KY312_02825 [Candidatus Woesearchaeota archaeon]|nr:hypothetical protein [Candidatus Woesearchaeota archaeon]
MFDNKDSWLKSLPEYQKKRVDDCINRVIEFSKGEYNDFFRNCGLYAIGSSVEKSNPNDTDIVLVGLDFRAVIEYNKIFLQDPETLVKEKIVIPVDEARRFGTKKIFGGMRAITSEGIEKPKIHSLPESPDYDADSIDDLNPIDQFMLAGIEYNNQYWCYNIQRLGDDALTLHNYCLYEGKPSNIVKRLHETIAAEKYIWYDLLHPFEPYFHPKDWFLTCSFKIHHDRCEADILKEKKCICVPLDFIVHAENLHVPHWKQHQKHTGFPFIPLYEWPDADKVVENRPIITQLPYHEAIDPNGIERVKWHSYFGYLEPTPITVNSKTLKST